MKIFNCIVQLGGNHGTINPHHEVPKMGISRAEVILLRKLHGMDAVFNIVPVEGEFTITTFEEVMEGGRKQFKEVKTTPDDMGVYRYLCEQYVNRANPGLIVSIVEGLFNVRLADLAQGLPDLEAGLDDVPAETGKRTAPAKNSVDGDPDLVPPQMLVGQSGGDGRRPAV